MEQIDLKEKERIDKILDEWNADVKEMQDAFTKFSEKHKDNIAGFTIFKLGNSCWYLKDVIMNGKMIRPIDMLPEKS